MLKRLFLTAATSIAAILFFIGQPAGAQESDTPNLDHDHHGHPHNHPHATEPPTKERFFTTRSSDVVLPLPGEEDAFVFAVFGDRTGGPPEGVNVLADAVRDVNLIEPDLVMTVGDLINGYNQTPQWLAQMREYKAIMSKLLCPWFPVAGNHDIYWRPTDDPEMPRGQHEKHYEMHFGPLWYSFQHKNSNFIVLYSDEGNPQTGEKDFTSPAAQKISDQQLAFLKEALQRGQACDHQFLFLHHPRWLGDRYGNDWRERVHPLLKETGNVTAVFAGHIHHMRYDPQDGIEYVTLATVGGGQSGKVPEAGFLHHYHLITVRPEQVAMAALPVGEAMDVREITGKLQQETVALAQQEPAVSGQVRVTDDGPQAAAVTVSLRNPTSRPVEFTLTPSSQDSRWVFSPDHDHGRLEPGESATLELAMDYVGESVDEGFRGVELKLTQDYLTDTTRYTIPTVTAAVPMRIEMSAPSQSLANRTLRLDGKNDAVRVAPEAATLPQGPFTLEAWFQAERFGDRTGLVTKNQSSEFGIFVSDGRPSASVHLGGSYRSLHPDVTLSRDRWYHIAAVYDGESYALFLDGRQLQRRSVSPKWQRKTNELPLFIGADPDSDGAPMSFFQGQIDEVRLSDAAIYQQPFEPQRRLKRRGDTVLLYQFDFAVGRLAYDSGPRQAHGQMIGGSRLSEPAEPVSASQGSASR